MVESADSGSQAATAPQIIPDTAGAILIGIRKTPPILLLPLPAHSQTTSPSSAATSMLLHDEALDLVWTRFLFNKQAIHLHANKGNQLLAASTRLSRTHKCISTAADQHAAHEGADWVPCYKGKLNSCAAGLVTIDCKGLLARLGALWSWENQI